VNYCDQIRSVCNDFSAIFFTSVTATFCIYLASFLSERVFTATAVHLFPGVIPPGPVKNGRERREKEGKGREGKGREGKGREGKGREGKGREGKGTVGKGGGEGRGRGRGDRRGGREGLPTKCLSVKSCPAKALIINSLWNHKLV
jgi:hypothetical protein